MGEFDPVSAQEIRLRGIVAARLPGEEAHYNVRPEWLRNPRTGYRLELDIFYPSLNLAFEYNGWQHNTVDVSRGVDKHQVTAQMGRDRTKYAKCAARGIHVYIVTARDLGNPKLAELIDGWIAYAKSGVPAHLANTGPLLQAAGRKVQPFVPSPKAPMTHRQRRQAQNPARVGAVAHELTPYEAENLERYRGSLSNKAKRSEAQHKRELAKRLERTGSRGSPTRA